MKLLPILFPSILAAAALCARAAGADSLGVEAATREALARNPDVAAAAALWDAARQRVAEEGAWDDPQLSAMSRATRFAAIPRNAFADQTVSLAQMLPISGKNLVRARAAAAEALMSYEDLRRHQLDTAAAARTAFFRLGNARAHVELNRENLVLLNQIVQVSRVRYESGGQSAADVLAAQAAAGRLLDSARELQHATAAEEANLNAAMGRDPFSPVPELAPPAPISDPPTASALEALMLASRPELRAAQLKLDAAQARLQLARRAWFPDPTLTVQGQRYNSGQAIDELDAGISFSIPWSNAGKYSSAIREAAANLAAARLALDSARLDSLRLLRTNLDDLTTATHHLHVSSGSLLKQARDTLEAAQIGYQAGKTGLADWLSAAQSVREVQAMNLDEQRDLQSAAAALEALVGAPIFNHP